MNANEIFFYAAISGAIVILLFGGFRIVRKYPRMKKHPTIADEDPNLYAVAMRAWETGRPVVGTVDEHGTLTMREVGEEWDGMETERERIRKQEVCSDKSHWKQSRVDQ